MPSSETRTATLTDVIARLLCEGACNAPRVSSLRRVRPESHPFKHTAHWRVGRIEVVGPLGSVAYETLWRCAICGQERRWGLEEA